MPLSGAGHRQLARTEMLLLSRLDGWMYPSLHSTLAYAIQLQVAIETGSGVWRTRLVRGKSGAVDCDGKTKNCRAALGFC